MASTGDGQPHFQVVLSALIAEKLRWLQDRAWDEGRGQAFISAFRTMGLRLIESPADFGEAMYRLPALRMQVRHAAVGPLLVYFGVCENLPLVFIKDVTLLPHKNL